MFTRPQIEHHDFAAVPVGHDTFLMDEKWMTAYDEYIDAIYAGATEAPGVHLLRVSAVDSTRSPGSLVVRQHIRPLS